MKVRSSFSVLAVAASAVFVMRLQGAEPAPPVSAAMATIDDPGFKHHLDIEDLQQALNQLDGAALTDLALQLAEGERVLLRKHASNVTPQALLEVAMKLAATAQDGATLARIGRAAEQLKLADLQTRAAALAEVAKSSRSADSGGAALEPGGPNESRVLFDQLKQQIQLAAAVGDRAGLELMRSELGQQTLLSKEQQSQLLAAVTAALADLSGGGAEPAGSDSGALLRQLAGESRVIVRPGTVAIDTNAMYSQPSNFLCRFDNYSSYDMYITVSLGSRVVSQFVVKPNTASRVCTIRFNPAVDPWPTVKAGISPTNNATSQLNFRNHPGRLNPRCGHCEFRAEELLSMLVNERMGRTLVDSMSVSVRRFCILLGHRDYGQERPAVRE